VKQLAPFVVDGAGGVVLGRNGYQTNELDFPTIAPERIIRNNDLKGRVFGEEILGAMTPEERAQKMQAEDLIELRGAIMRRVEWMARQVLTTGKLEIFRYTNEGLDKQTTCVADFGFTNFYTPSNAWSGASATIDDDMKAMLDLVYDGSGDVNVIVMAGDAASALINNGNYKGLRDIKDYDIGALATRYQGQGVRFLGWNIDGVEMYAYSGKYVDDDGTTKPILPSGTVIMGSRGMLKKICGPVTQIEQEGQDAAFRTYIKEYVPLRYGSIRSNALKNRMTSRPTLIPFNVDGWCVANVL